MRELMTQAEIDADREKWIEMRRGLITGTDVAAIVGADDEYGPAAVYWSKVHKIERPDTMAYFLGRHDEAALAELFIGDHPDIHPGYLTPGNTLQQAGLCVHDDRDWQGCTFDRVEEPSGNVVEFKTSVIRDGFGPPPHGDIPLRMFIQALWEADVRGADLVKLVVLIRPFGPFHCYWINIDSEARSDLALFRAKAVEFRERYLLPRIPPPTDGKDGTTVALKSAFNELAPTDIAVVPKHLWQAALRARARRDLAKEQLQAAQNEIAATMGNAKYAQLRDGTRVMQRSLSWPRRIDSTLLRATHPEIAEAVTKQPPIDQPEIRYLLKDPKE